VNHFNVPKRHKIMFFLQLIRFCIVQISSCNPFPVSAITVVKEDWPIILSVISGCMVYIMGAVIMFEVAHLEPHYNTLLNREYHSYTFHTYNILYLIYNM